LIYCKDVMTRSTLQMRPERTACDCARAMKTEGLTVMPIVDEQQRVIAAITERDLVVTLLADDIPASTPLGVLIHPSDLFTCRGGDDLRKVEELMSELRKPVVIVVDDMRHCQGIITFAEISRADRPARTGRLVHDVMRRSSKEPRRWPGRFAFSGLIAPWG
jgi:CBS domain-containing protein